MFGKLGHIMGKVARWAGATLAALAIGLPAAMYIPWVQNKAADIAADIASKKTGMDISVGDVRVRFPLDVSATDVQVIDQNGDTLFRADEVKANVKPGPLFDKKIDADNVSLKGAKSQIKTDDGSMDLDVDVDSQYTEYPTNEIAVEAKMADIYYHFSGRRSPPTTWTSRWT